MIFQRAWERRSSLISQFICVSPRIRWGLPSL
jgi:hypothetical protein